MFGAHTLVQTWRKTEHLAGKLKGTMSMEIFYHASSVRIDARNDAGFFADGVRGEWSEEKYHARRDGTYCEDIRTRRCEENVTLLSRTFSLLFYFFTHETQQPQGPSVKPRGAVCFARRAWRGAGSTAPFTSRSTFSATM